MDDKKGIEYELTVEGNLYKDNGSPEAFVTQFLREYGPMTLEQIKQADPQLVGVFREYIAVGLCQAIKRQWIAINKNDKTIRSLVPVVVDGIQQNLQMFVEHPHLLSNQTIVDLKARKLIKQKL